MLNVGGCNYVRAAVFLLYFLALPMIDNMRINTFSRSRNIPQALLMALRIVGLTTILLMLDGMTLILYYEGDHNSMVLL